MWFADVGLDLAWALLAGWLLVLMLSAALSSVRSVLPAAARVPVLAGSGVAVALFTAQAVVVDRVADTAGTGLVDRSVLGWFVGHRDAAATAVSKALSTVGGTAGMAVLALIGAVLLWRARHRAAAGIVIVAAVGAAVLVTGFKNLYGRARPPVADRLTVETNASLPSGHALGSIVVLGVLAAVVVLLVRRRAARTAAVAIAAVGVAAIGGSRLYLGVHWATDVATGWLLGGAWLAVCVTALVLLHARSPGPVPAHRRGRRNRDGPGVAAADR